MARRLGSLASAPMPKFLKRVAKLVIQIAESNVCLQPGDQPAPPAAIPSSSLTPQGHTGLAEIVIACEYEVGHPTGVDDIDGVVDTGDDHEKHPDIGHENGQPAEHSETTREVVVDGEGANLHDERVARKHHIPAQHGGLLLHAESFRLLQDAVDEERQRGRRTRIATELAVVSVSGRQLREKKA